MESILSNIEKSEVGYFVSKEHIDDYKDAEIICEKLTREGYHEPVIKKIG